MMRTDAGYTDERNQQQKWPLRETATNRRNLSAVANRSVDLVLVKNLNVALRRLRRQIGTGDQ